MQPELELHDVEEAAEAESTLALAQVQEAARRVRKVGARLVFTFWVEGGALTLTGYEAHPPQADTVDASKTADALQSLRVAFSTYIRGHSGEVNLVLTRYAQGWNVDYHARGHLSRPAEARTLPVRRWKFPDSARQALAQFVRARLAPLTVSQGGARTVDIQVSMEDERVVDWQWKSLQLLRSGESLLGPPVQVEQELTAILLPFTQGLGSREVHLKLLLEHRAGERHSHGQVVSAYVLRPEPPPAMSADFAAQYRTMHEDILRRWREETREAAKWVARQGAEELALWYAGGIITRGAGLFAAQATPILIRALRRGSQAAAGWLRSALTRMPIAQRQAFERLWTKVQLEGAQALSTTERQELRSLMEGLEQLIRQPLGRDAKKELREKARRYYKKLHPELAELIDSGTMRLPIHHRRPLEYAHLFPDMDINAADNLVMLREQVHTHVNALWSKFRHARPNATAKEVEIVARKIDDRFAPWYHRADDPAQPAHSLDEAAQATLDELKKLFAGLN